MTYVPIVSMKKDPICGMNVDEKTALALVKAAERFFFCSEYCRRKFAGEHRIEADDCDHCAPRPFSQNKIFLISAALPALIF